MEEMNLELRKLSVGIKQESRLLSNFYFYKNVNRIMQIFESVLEYNLKHPEYNINLDDVLLGPDLKEYDSYSPNPHITRNKRFGFDYDYSRGYSPEKLPAGFYVFQEKGLTENLERVFENFNQDEYLSRLSVRAAYSDEYHGVSVSPEELVGMIEQLAVPNNWNFEKIVEKLWQVGYLTVLGEKYMIKESICPIRYSLYNQDGTKLDLSNNLSKYKEILSKIQMPVFEKMEMESLEFRKEWPNVYGSEE